MPFETFSATNTCTGTQVQVFYGFPRILPSKYQTFVFFVSFPGTARHYTCPGHVCGELRNRLLQLADEIVLPLIRNEGRTEFPEYLVSVAGHSDAAAGTQQDDCIRVSSYFNGVATADVGQGLIMPCDDDRVGADRRGLDRSRSFRWQGNGGIGRQRICR